MSVTVKYGKTKLHKLNVQEHFASVWDGKLVGDYTSITTFQPGTTHKGRTANVITECGKKIITDLANVIISSQVDEDDKKVVDCVCKKCFPDQEPTR